MRALCVRVRAHVRHTRVKLVTVENEMKKRGRNCVKTVQSPAPGVKVSIPF